MKISYDINLYWFQKLYEEASQVASDAVGSIRTVASFSSEEKVMRLYEMKCKKPRKAGIQRGLISGVGFGMSMLLLYLVYAISFYVGARFVEAGKTTYAKVFQVGQTYLFYKVTSLLKFATNFSRKLQHSNGIFCYI